MIMNESTLTKMRQMKLSGMHGAFKTAVETGKLIITPLISLYP